MDIKSIRMPSNTIPLLPNTFIQKTNQVQLSCFLFDDRYAAQIISDWMLDWILLKVIQAGQIQINQDPVRTVIQNIYDCQQAIQTSISPVFSSYGSENTIVNFKLESQPARIQYDPRCGFDRAIVRKIEPKAQQNSSNNLLKLTKYKNNRKDSLSKSKQKPNGLTNERKLIHLSGYHDKYRNNFSQNPLIDSLVESSKPKRGSKLNSLHIGNSNLRLERSKVYGNFSRMNSFKLNQQENSIYGLDEETIKNSSKSHHLKNMTGRPQKNSIIRIICEPLQRALVSSLHQNSRSSLVLNSSKMKIRQKSETKQQTNPINTLVPQKATINQTSFGHIPTQPQNKNSDILPTSLQIQADTCSQSQFQMTKNILNSSKNQYVQLHTLIESKLPNFKQNFKLVQENKVSIQQPAILERAPRIKKMAFDKYKHHQTKRNLI